MTKRERKLAIGATLVAAIGGGMFLWDDPAPATAAGTASASASPSASASAPPAKSVSKPAASQRTPLPATPRGAPPDAGNAGAGIRPAQMMATDPGGLRDGYGEPVRKVKVRESAPALVAQPKRITGPRAADSGTRKPPASPGKGTEANPLGLAEKFRRAIAKELPAREKTQVQQKEQKKAPFFDGLPPAHQVKLTGILWAQKPASRMAIVDTMLLRVGSTFHGARLQAIEKDRVVFSRKEQTLEVAISR